ncbi:type II secretion system minor pseudopilin GspJ [Enterobacter cloacae]|uniref:type II secretion system minor pseudopilin GspJ n=1 Tax=Enterobacter cloacae TaxID=550 RepID=UPI00101B0446|nr:type II secretion system minor pseudopilin GspJ [Enterobacter cloacae]QBC03376.1 type II secretion system protein GspJ [Enterobacter cloacae]
MNMIPLQRGFTLLEMLVALMLFALLGLMGFQVLNGVLRSSELSHQHASLLSEAQQAFNLLEQDISQAIEPTASGHLLAQLQLPTHHPSLRLLRHNWLNPNGWLPRASLEWVVWSITEEGLLRQSFGYPASPEPGLATSFPSVRAMKLRYWSGGQWRAHWAAAIALPQAIEVTLEMTGYGALQRVIFITEGK